MNYYIKYMLQRAVSALLLPFRLFPVREDRILFLSLEGGSSCEFSCNPRSFCEYLLANRPGRYELVWLFREPEKYRFLRKYGVRTARHFSPRGLYYALTSRVVITNGGYLTWFPFRKKQVCINTWHAGGAYKKLENDMTGANAATRRRMLFASAHTAAFVSGCEKFSEYEIRNAFLYRGTILPIGMPRNDIFFSGACSRKYSHVRERLGLPSDARILLYAPTFRSGKDRFEPFSASRVLDCLEEQSGAAWRFLYRAHTQSGDPAMTAGLDGRCLDVSSFPDTQALLCAADLLVTDYSSILWDFSLTERPIVLYAPDLAAYTGSRGFYTDIREWGFPVCGDEEQLCGALRTLSPEAGRAADLRHRQYMGSCESGQACRSLLNYIEYYLPEKQTRGGAS